MANDIISYMLITRRTADVTAFYTRVFPGWTLSAPGRPRDWVAVDSGSGPGGIIMNQAYDAEPLAWLPCVEVDSIKTTIGLVKANHGTVVLGEEAMPDGKGTYAIIADPRGGKIAIRRP